MQRATSHHRVIVSSVISVAQSSWNRIVIQQQHPSSSSLLLRYSDDCWLSFTQKSSSSLCRSQWNRIRRRTLDFANKNRTFACSSSSSLSSPSKPTTATATATAHSFSSTTTLAATSQLGVGGTSATTTGVVATAPGIRTASYHWAYTCWRTFIDRPMTWYTKTLDRFPLMTKCITAGVLACVGDITSQLLLRHHNQNKQQQDCIDNQDEYTGGGQQQGGSIVLYLDWARTGRFVLINVFMVGPTLHFWYIWLAQRFPGTSIASVAKRVVLDEFIFTPFYYPIFLSILWKLEHGSTLSWHKIRHMLWHELPQLVVAEWCLYVPAQTLNFRFVPVKFQVLYCNLVGIAWNVYLSAKAQHAQDKHHRLPQKPQQGVNLITDVVEEGEDDRSCEKEDEERPDIDDHRKLQSIVKEDKEADDETGSSSMRL